MLDMEQPIGQEVKECESEKLHNVGVESNDATSNRNTESTVEMADKGSINLGKFKDAESLLKAYNSLQTEFTKKSQRLSELENSKSEFNRDEKINKAIEELTQNHSIAQKFGKEIKSALQSVDTDNYSAIVKDELIKNLATHYKTADEYIADEQFLMQYVYTNPTIRENIIRDYLANLTNASPVKVASNISSSIPISPPNIPATIKEAGSLAKNIIKQI